MGQRLWLDDERPTPWGYDLTAKTADECIRMLREFDDITHVSLDHDLAEEHYREYLLRAGTGQPLDRSKFEHLTGYAVVEWMVESGRWVNEIHVHTLNDLGAGDMLEKLLLAPEHVTVKRVKPWEV